MIREPSNEEPARPEVAAGGQGEFRFECTLCGDCCTGNQVVRLCAGDLVLLKAHLGFASVTDLRTQGLVTLVRESAGPAQTVWRPRILFRKKPLRQCPFLINDVDLDGSYRGLCALHPAAKPLVCVLSPLAREVSDPGTSPREESWSFVPPVEGCPGVGRGEVLTIEAPSTLRDRLDTEAAEMRVWIDRAAGLADEDAAWAALAPEVDR